MNIIFEQYEEEIRQLSIKELQDMMPGSFSSEEYENMFMDGLRGVMVLVNESSKLESFMSLVQSFPSVSAEDMKLINMQLGLFSLSTQSKFESVVASEGMDDTDTKHLAVENMNVAIVAAIATAIALIIKFWDNIFSFLFSPTEKSKKMAATAKDMKKDVKATGKTFANSSTKDKSEEEIAAYNNGKFIANPKFLLRYGGHGVGPYTSSQVIEAINNYSTIAKDGGFVDKVIDALYNLAGLYLSDSFYKPLEKLVDEIEKVSKLNTAIKNIDLRDVGNEVQTLAEKFSKDEAAAFKALLSLFPSTENKGSDGTEHHVGNNGAYGIIKNLYLYEKVNTLSFLSEADRDRNVEYRELNSSIPGAIKNPPVVLVELPIADERGAVTEKYLECFNASRDGNNGHFQYKGFSKHTEFNKGNFTKTLKDHSDKLGSLAERMAKYKSSFQATAALRLVNSSKTNISSISLIVAAIFTQTYKTDIESCEKLVKEIRNHDRDTRAKA